ncbi:MAG: Pyrophosphatase PpaX [Candidatus Omnitrophica bacterium ADurb.Bin292]|jgi:phosphoglycolate phosphatase-like HAD superfamily hydrolase|nr:MAG: Pyrophosphatase PpaX [Candidatus Omnitrophica bacterium ADurb.Bin292]HQB11775.1 HAD hydrolase-like protein [Candidatus Omnitrophota bacterium]
MASKIHPKYASRTRPPVEPRKFDAVLFDIDNVLVDTRRSYLEAIRYTVEIFLTHGDVPFFSKSSSGKMPELLSTHDVEKFKMLGGFNDDWDCCYGILVYLLSLPVTNRTIEALKKASNFDKLVKSVKERPLKVSGITAIYGRPSTLVIEKVARIFQEVYLGKDIFPRLTHNKMRYWKKRGLIDREKPIFKSPLLQKIKDAGMKLGICTGRSSYEAAYALKAFGMDKLFDAITTMDDVKQEERLKRESLRKPHPFSLLKTTEKLGKKLHYLYVGDLPDDVLAANRAKKSVSICSAAFPMMAADPFRAQKELEAAQPDYVLKSPSELFKILGIK